MNEINVALDPSDPYSDFIRLRGTSQGESTNRLTNQLVAELTMQSAELADKRLWLRMTRFNLAKDASLQKILGLQKVRSMDWFLQQELLKLHPGLSLYHGQSFPPELPNDYYEPIGIEYGRQKDWIHFDRMLVQWQLDKPRPPATTVVPMDEEATPTIISVAPPPAARLPNTSSETTTSPSRTNNYGPQARWSRSLTPMTAHHVSVSTIYHHKSVKFDEMQWRYFWRAVGQAEEFTGGTAPADEVYRLAARNWNEAHLQLCASGSIGLGGKLRDSHVRALLKQRGKQIKHSQVAGSSQSNLLFPGKFLTKDMVDTLSWRDAVPWLKKLRLPVQSTLQMRKDRLLEYFAKQVDR